MSNFPMWMGAVPRNCATWSGGEDCELLNTFKRGFSVKSLARKHGRSVRSIVTRLERVSPEFNSFVRNNISCDEWDNANSEILDMDMSDIYNIYDYKGKLIPPKLEPRIEVETLPPPKKKDACEDNCSAYKYCMVLLGILLVSVLIVSNLTL